MSTLINVDNGGTLTDVVVITDDRVYRIKTLTTPSDLSRCFAPYRVIVISTAPDVLLWRSLSIALGTFIAEVKYDGDKLSWVDDLRRCIRWIVYNDLKRTMELIRQAFGLVYIKHSPQHAIAAAEHA